jgi:hypothetical protein
MRATRRLRSPRSGMTSTRSELDSRAREGVPYQPSTRAYRPVEAETRSPPDPAYAARLTRSVASSSSRVPFESPPSRVR